MLNETKGKILSLVRLPRTFTELRTQTGITDRAILQHLRDLKSQGLIEQKEKHGAYTLTAKGQKKLGTQTFERALYTIAEKMEYDKRLKMYKSVESGFSRKDFEKDPGLRKALDSLKEAVETWNPDEA